MARTNPFQRDDDAPKASPLPFIAPQPDRAITDPDLPVTLYHQLVPFDQEELYVPNYMDDDHVVHFFAATDVSYQPDGSDIAWELKYFRAAQTPDGRLVHDAYPVMPLARQGDYPFPREVLETMLMENELDSARELAYHTAQSHGLPFPDPDTMPPLRTGVDYRFESAIEDDGSPAIRAVKAWREGALDKEERLTITSYGMAAELDVDMRELDELRQNEGLEAAMNLAEAMAVASGTLHDGREDTRMFSDGPPDPFVTNTERDRADEVEFVRDISDMDTQELPAVAPANPYADWAAERERVENASLQGAAWFEATFEGNPEIALLEPVHDSVNYAVVVTDIDPWTSELMVEKFWREPGGFVGSDSFTIDTYDSDDETDREQAQADRAALLEVHEQRGLQAMMWRAELDAIENGHLEQGRENLHLFRRGPYDNFETLAQRLDGEVNPYWNTSGEQIETLPDETQELPAVTPEPGSWDELVAEQRDQVEPEPERHYWQMHYRSVETPDGEKLGTALFVTEFPELPPNFDDYIEKWGMDDTVYPTEARTLEMAHFASEADAEKFDAEFRSYLVPGLLDGPELAPEVAKLEGLSGEWEDMDYDEIVGYMSGHRTIVREEGDWYLHDPNAEREAKEQFENPLGNIDL
jgi:hypothetical protein